jgi:hypothetical protein
MFVYLSYFSFCLSDVRLLVTFVSLCLYICLSIYLTSYVCLFISLQFFVSLCLFICLSIYSTSVSVCRMSVSVLTDSSVCLSVYLYVCLFISLQFIVCSSFFLWVYHHLSRSLSIFYSIHSFYSKKIVFGINSEFISYIFLKSSFPLICI